MPEPTEPSEPTIVYPGTWSPTENLLPTGTERPIFSGKGETMDPIARIINQFSKVLNYGYDHKPSKVLGYDILHPSNEIHTN